jgi:FAD-dependent monooxygenase
MTLLTLAYLAGSSYKRSRWTSLLDSYEAKRRPVAFMSVEHSKTHMGVHNKLSDLLQHDPSVLDTDTKKGQEAREEIYKHYQIHDGENKKLGVEMGFRYHSQINMPDEATELTWTPTAYILSTFPGSRAPHVFWKDGNSIFDRYG